jgi:uncharacterized membrane protein (DUF2068 family)
MRGHVTPAADASTIRPDDAAIGVELGDGRRLARCLRCDMWIEHRAPDQASALWPSLPPIDELAKPRRGKALAEVVVMKLIAINKGLHAFAFTLLAIVLTLLESNLDRVHDWAGDVGRKLSDQLADTGQQASRGWMSRQLQRLFDLQTSTVKVLLILAIAYAVIEWTEAIGLWKEKRWAEYLTVVATTGFLPLEIHELILRVTIVRVGALIVNVALVVWLVYDKHLFHLRGGVHTLHDDSSVDWHTVLAAPTPARGRMMRVDRSPQPQLGATVTDTPA